MELVEGPALAAGDVELAAGLVELAEGPALAAGDVVQALASGEEQALADGVQLTHRRTSDWLSPHLAEAELVPL
jgi:hypothetical protein